MTDEELKYYKALQPVFKKKMGDYLRYDRIMEKEGMGSIGHIQDAEYANYCQGKNLIDFIHLPLPIDPENPERGLNGMLESGILYVGRVRSMIEIEGINYFHSPTPTLTLLKALAHQEGITA